jgi:SAM-dependent methyltransferase
MTISELRIHHGPRKVESETAAKANLLMTKLLSGGEISTSDWEFLKPGGEMVWKRSERFDPAEALTMTKRPFLEVGGPTDRGYGFASFNQFDSPVFISSYVASNIEYDTEPWDNLIKSIMGNDFREEQLDSLRRERKERVQRAQLETRRSKLKRADLIADGTNLPLPDDSVGALFVSYVPGDIGEMVLEEAKRVIAKGGYLVWQGGRGLRKDMENLTRFGFIPMQARILFKDNRRAGPEGLLDPYPVFEPIMLQKPSNA